jgi:hypothetical protein
MLIHQLGAGFLLVTCTLWLQSAGIAVLVAWIRHAAEGDIQEMGTLRASTLVVRFTTAVVLLHGLEILLWATFYRLILLTLLGLSVLLLGKHLFDCWLQRSNSTSRFATVWTAREHHRRVDVRNIREPSVCDSHPAHQPRCAFIAQIAEARNYGCSFGAEGLIMQEHREPSTHSKCITRPRVPSHKSRSNGRLGVLMPPRCSQSV